MELDYRPLPPPKRILMDPWRAPHIAHRHQQIYGDIGNIWGNRYIPVFLMQYLRKSVDVDERYGALFMDPSNSFWWGQRSVVKLHTCGNMGFILPQDKKKTYFKYRLNFRWKFIFVPYIYVCFSFVSDWNYFFIPEKYGWFSTWPEIIISLGFFLVSETSGEEKIDEDRELK